LVFWSAQCLFLEKRTKKKKKTLSKSQKGQKKGRKEQVNTKGKMVTLIGLHQYPGEKHGMGV
jgi:hypothetical protein